MPGGPEVWSVIRVLTGPRLVRGMQVVILALGGYGFSAGNPAVVVNALLGLLATFLPAILRRDFGIAMETPLVAWIAIAALLHTVGMVGPYETVWWWDHLTHTLSATLVAGVGFAVTRAIDEYWEDIYLPPDFMFVYIVVFTLAAGVLWEVLEFVGRELTLLVGKGPILVQYSLADSVIDLLFDGIGGVFVAAFGQRRFDRLIASIERAIERTDDEERSLRP